jgi:hypothetical protein
MSASPKRFLLLRLPTEIPYAFLLFPMRTLLPQ